MDNDREPTFSEQITSKFERVDRDQIMTLVTRPRARCSNSGRPAPMMDRIPAWSPPAPQAEETVDPLARTADAWFPSRPLPGQHGLRGKTAPAPVSCAPAPTTPDALEHLLPPDGVSGDIIPLPYRTLVADAPPKVADSYHDIIREITGGEPAPSPRGAGRPGWQQLLLVLGLMLMPLVF